MLAVSGTIRPEEFEDKDDVGGPDEPSTEPPTSAQLREQLKSETAELLDFVEESASAERYEPFERELIRRVFQLSRLLIALFLCLASERLEVPTLVKRGRAQYRRQPPKSRRLGTFFGKVRYWRTYLHQTKGRGGGYFPLDVQLGLTSDGFSFGLLSRAVQLATKMSFAAAARVMASFLDWAPATKSIEQAVLGLGRYTAAWFEQWEPPEDEGEVLVIQIDSKAAPTARADELRKRRGKRQPNPYRGSSRHRGRARRSRWRRKKRRKKGDKSKNGKMSTLVVMYTLKRATAEDGSVVLLGPRNQWVYASFAPKRHAVAIARREADKRGFTQSSGKTIQVVTDGDPDLARYIGELLPTAIHTLDIMHVIERLWTAGGCLFREGSKDLERWIELQKERLYAGDVWNIILELESEHSVMKQGTKRKRLDEVLNYLIRRTKMMNYDELADQDLELASGAVEGAVRYVIAQRFDEGGMRWIKERAEPLLQLRCIDINGHWDDFINFAHSQIDECQTRTRRAQRLLQKKPESLTTWGLK